MQLKYLETSILKWFKFEKRDLPFRGTKDPYKIWLSEVMLQQTKVVSAIPYYNKWIKKYPTLFSVSQENINNLLKLWEGLGYYSRCRNFHQAAKIVCKKYDGKVPSDWETFISLPGVGDYTASAVLSIAFGKKYVTIDGNVRRVIYRLLGLKRATPFNEKRVKKTLERLIPNISPGDFNQSMMELGALICNPRNPKCGSCPLNYMCKAFKSKNPENYPQRIKKLKAPTYQYIAGIIRHNKKFLITKRDENSMLGGLWELPNFRVDVLSDLEKIYQEKIKDLFNIKIMKFNTIGIISHKYSHFTATVKVFNCMLFNLESFNGKKYKWISLKEVTLYPFSKINHKIFSMMRKKNINV